MSVLSRVPAVDEEICKEKAPLIENDNIKPMPILSQAAAFEVEGIVLSDDDRPDQNIVLNYCDSDTESKGDDSNDDLPQSLVKYQDTEEERAMARQRVDRLVDKAKQNHMYGGFWQSFYANFIYECISMLLFYGTIAPNIALYVRWITMNYSISNVVLCLMIDIAFFYAPAFSLLIKNEMVWWKRVLMMPLFPLVVRFISHQQSEPDPHQSKLFRFIEEKKSRHAPFVFAGVSSFYVSLIQMEVLINYNDIHWLPVLSLLMNIFNVCWSLFVYLQIIFDRNDFIFTYISLVTDYITVLCFIVWYKCHSPHYCISDIGVAFLWKCLPTILIVFLWSVWEYFHFIYDRHRNTVFGWCLTIVFMIVFPVIVPWLTFEFTLITESLCFTIITLVFVTNRFNNGDATGIFWERVFKFIRESESKQDQTLRLVVLNYTLVKHIDIDDHLRAYLENEEENCFENVNLEHLRNHSIHSDFNSLSIFQELIRLFREGWDKWADEAHCQWLKRVWIVPYAYVIFIIYLISRLFNVLFVWYGLISRGFLNSNQVHCFTLGLLGSLQLAWLISLVIMIRYHYATWHILPGHRKINIVIQDANDAHLKVQYILDVYSKVPMLKPRPVILADFFDDDVARVILEYLPSLSEVVDKSDYGLIWNEN